MGDEIEAIGRVLARALVQDNEAEGIGAVLALVVLALKDLRRIAKAQEELVRLGSLSAQAQECTMHNIHGVEAAIRAK